MYLAFEQTSELQRNLISCPRISSNFCQIKGLFEYFSHVPLITSRLELILAEEAFGLLDLFHLFLPVQAHRSDKIIKRFV
jgi:hypothetical protein